MNPFFGADEVGNYSRLRKDVEDFRARYLAYVGDPTPERRAELMRLIPLAERACHIAYVEPNLQNPLGDVASGISNIALAYENPRFTIARGSQEQIIQLVLDSLDRAIGSLAEHERVARERESSLGYRVERAARKFFGLPVRILGIVLGFNPDDLEGAKARLAFLGSVFAMIAMLYGGSTKLFDFIRALGAARGWW